MHVCTLMEMHVTTVNIMLIESHACVIWICRHCMVMRNSGVGRHVVSIAYDLRRMERGVPRLTTEQS